MTPKKKICFIVSSQLTLKAFLINHIDALSKEFSITLVANIDNQDFLSKCNINATIKHIPIQRKISILYDLYSLFSLFWFFRKNRFDVIHSVTPKAGFLAVLAGFFAGIKLRWHMYTGQVWANKNGLKRFVLKIFDRVIAIFATQLFADSKSQMEFLVNNRIVSADKIYTFANGSISGVDPKRFKPDIHARIHIRKQLNINSDTFVLLFVGRLNKDKGILDLISALCKINQKYNYHLLIIGPDEENIKTRILSDYASIEKNITFIDYTDEPELYMAASDLLCLPSYREGFGLVIIEAAALGIPSVASKIYGITDAIVDGETGLLHNPKDVDDIKSKIIYMIENKHHRIQMGLEAQKRAITFFSQEIVTEAWLQFYRNKLSEIT